MNCNQYKQEEIKIISPFRVDVPRKTMPPVLYSLNLNQYRNWHPNVESKVKKRYSEKMKDQLEGLVFNRPITIEYRVFKPTRRRLDKMNVVAVVSKYFQDSLVDWGCLPDDNDDFIKDEVVKPTVYDKDNGRVELIIKQVDI